MNQDGFVNEPDFTIFAACFGFQSPSVAGPPDDPDCGESDMDGNGVVGGADFTLFRKVFNGPPGPP